MINEYQNLDMYFGIKFGDDPINEVDHIYLQRLLKYHTLKEF